MSALVFAGIVAAYDELTQPASGSQERMDPWPTRAATIGVLMLWVAVVPTLANILARLFSVRNRPLLILAVVVLLAATLPLLWFLSAINSCHADIGFPMDTNC
jgi:hypothetical protein